MNAALKYLDPAAQLAALQRQARTDDNARLILADAWDESGRLDVGRLWRDELPVVEGKRRRRLDKLTKAEEARFQEWREKWIRVGHSTQPADRPLFEAAVTACYRHTGLKAPHIVWVNNPLVAVLAGALACARLYGKHAGSVGAVGGAVGDAVDGAVDGAVRDAVGGAVGDAVDGAVRDAVGDAVDGAVRDAVGDAVRDAVRDAVGGAVGDAVDGADPAKYLKLDDIEKQIVERLRWHFFYGNLNVGWWWGSPSYASFCVDVGRLQLEPEIELRARAWQAQALSASMWFPGKDFVIVSERPTALEWKVDTSKWDATPDGWRIFTRANLKRVAWRGWEVTP